MHFVTFMQMTFERNFWNTLFSDWRVFGLLVHRQPFLLHSSTFFFPVPCVLSAFWLLFTAFVHDRVCIFIVGGLTAATIWKIQRNLLLFAQRQLESNSTPVQRQMTWWLPHSVIQCNATNSQLKAGLMSMHLQLAHTYTRGAYTRFT